MVRSSQRPAAIPTTDPLEPEAGAVNTCGPSPIHGRPMSVRIPRGLFRSLKWFGRDDSQQSTPCYPKQGAAYQAAPRPRLPLSLAKRPD